MSLFNQRREEIFNKYTKRKHVIQNNYKTKMCDYVSITGFCPFKKCTYAHTIEELRMPACWFKDVCKNVNCPYDH